jgi:hypothetical protein
MGKSYRAHLYVRDVHKTSVKNREISDRLRNMREVTK